MAAGPATPTGGKKISAAQTVGVLNLLTDLAFNLLIFFVVLASTEPEKGRSQQVPSSSEDKTKAVDPKSQQTPEVRITRTTQTLNQEEVTEEALQEKLTEMLKGKVSQEERIVIVASDPDTPYRRWIKVTGIIQNANGMITLQLEDEKRVEVKQ